MAAAEPAGRIETYRPMDLGPTPWTAPSDLR